MIEDDELQQRVEEAEQNYQKQKQEEEVKAAEKSLEDNFFNNMSLNPPLMPL